MPSMRRSAYTYSTSAALYANHQYVADVERQERLSDEQECALIARAQQGDETAACQLIESCLAVVYRKAVRYAQMTTVETLDLAQVGNLAMCQKLAVALTKPNPVAYLIRV